MTPGVASGVTAAAELVDGGGLKAVRSLARVLLRERAPQHVPERFETDLVHADTDPVSLADRLADGGLGPVSFCLQGPGRALSCATSPSGWELKWCRSAPPI